MSVDYTTHFGPFIKATFHKIDSFCEKSICPNASCKNFNNKSISKFCDSCGSKIETKDFPVSKKSVGYIRDVLLKAGMSEDAIIEVSDNIFSDYYDKGEKRKKAGFEFADIFLPNNLWTDNKTSTQGKLTGVHRILKENDITEDIALFAKEYKDVIAVLEKHYDKVEIMWGVLTEAN